MSRTNETVPPPDGRDPGPTRWILAAILLVATGLRGYQLGRASFWYDEVVTMRLARAGSPAALIDQLFRIDATRAPLHPLLLRGWLGVFGVSEASARALSVLCGIATLWLVFEIGRSAFDAPTGLWAAWLAAVSPVLIVYSREARMYAWLVLVACVCWRILLGRRRPITTAGAIAYALALVALAYSHPLGLIMMGTLSLAGLLGVHSGFGSWERWLAIHGAAAAAVVPWIPRYLDHAPEFLSGPLPLRFLLGTPIGFLGGNFAVLAGMVLLIVWGIANRGVGMPHRREASPDGPSPLAPMPSGPTTRDPVGGRWMAPTFLLLWLVVPPSALYAYSVLFQPIFGPPRYTVYSAPAFLILVASGLACLPAMIRYPTAVGLTILAVSGLGSKVYDPTLKADWRGFATESASRSAGPTMVIVAPPGPGPNVEVETARYYLPAGCEAIPLEEATADRLDRAGSEAIYLAVGSRRNVPAMAPPERIGSYRFRPDRAYPGLMTLRAEHGTTMGGPPLRGGGGSPGGGDGR